MKTIKIQDKYNSAKVWILTRYSCGHYAMNQEICGNRFYKRDSRTTVNHLGQVFNRDNNHVRNWFN